MNIKVELKTNISDGTEVVFRSPADCSQVTGLSIYHTGGKTEFAFADAHGNNVGDIDHLFAENAVVKVILDVTAGMAFVQNADTNAYIERTFIKSVNRKVPDEAGNVELNANDVGALTKDALQDGVNLALQQAKESGVFDGKDGEPGLPGKDGDDYILTDEDKREIADMIPIPDMPGGGGDVSSVILVISVKDHGAFGDGVADDTGAIQAALDASHANGGGTVIIPTGTYLLSDAVKFYSNQHIIGEPGAVLLQKDGNTGGAWGNLMRNYYNGSGGYDATENVIIEGLTFDGGTQEDAPSTLLAFCHAKNITVRGCTFLNGFSGGEVGNGHDIEVNGSRNVDILNCTFGENRRKGFQSEIVQLDAASGSGAYPWAPDEGSRTDDNTISASVTVADCYFKGTLYEDVYSRNVGIGSHCAAVCKDVVVTGCTIEDVAYGVLLNYGENVFVHGNYILNSTVGFYANLEGNGLRFIGNILENCGNAYRTSRISGHGNMLNGVHFEEPKTGEGGSIEVSGAVPGQFLKVAEVDENGVPTAWETAEMPADEWELIVDYTVPEGVQVDTLEFTKDLNGNDFDLKKCIFYTVITATEEGSNSTRNINCITSKSAKKKAWTNGVAIGTSQTAGDPTSKRRGYMVYLEVAGNTYLAYGYTGQNEGSLWETVGQNIFRSMNFDKTTNVMHDGCSDIAEINCFRIHSLGTNIMGVGSTIKIMGVRK